MKGAFIDRDGVIIEERSYAYRIEDFAPLPGAVAALGELQAAGYRLIVITNQSGIARGLYSEEDYLAFSAHMERHLEGQGVRLDAVEYCPHLPEAPMARYRLDCDCRKPGPAHGWISSYLHCGPQHEPCIVFLLAVIPHNGTKSLSI